MGMWRNMYSFRDDFDMEEDDYKDELKKAYHEGMKDGIRYARRGGSLSLRHDDDEDYYREHRRESGYSERGRDSYGRFR